MLFLRKSLERETTIRSNIPDDFKDYHIHGARKIYYDDEKRAVFSQYIVVPCFTIWYHVIKVYHEVEISPLSINPGLKLNFMLSVIKASAALNSGGEVTLAPGEANLFLVGEGMHYAKLPKGEYIFSTLI